mgnify:CR=1 FL=1
MWSEYSLEVVDAVARNGSFSAAAQELHRVPSAVSYTVRQLEEWLAVPLFERRHRDVELTPAGVWFLQEGRSVIKKMQITRQQCQQIANGWRGQLSIAVDDIVKPARMRQMIVDFYRHFPDVELIVFQEVFNGVWDALADGRVELAIGATRSIPVGGRYAFRDMGMLSWDCVVASDHPLAKMDGPLSDDVLRNWPSLVREDTSRSLPKRTTWLLDNQKRVVVPDWESSATCLSAGLCVGMVPSHFARPWIDRGEWTALALENPFPDAACCLTWQQNDASPALKLDADSVRADILCRDMKGLLARLPGLETLAFNDGTPFADEVTLNWLNERVLDEMAGWQDEPVMAATSADEVLSLEPEVLTRADDEGIESALNWLQAQPGYTTSRNRWLMRLLMARVSEQYGKNEMALHLLAELDSRAREMTLEQWKPELIFEVKARRLRLLRGKAGRSEAEKNRLLPVIACRAHRSGSRSRRGAVRIIHASFTLHPCTCGSLHI